MRSFIAAVARKRGGAHFEQLEGASLRRRLHSQATIVFAASVLPTCIGSAGLLISTLFVFAESPAGAATQPPTAPTSLAQLTTTDQAIATGSSTDLPEAKFSASVSDGDSSDTLQLCVEIDVNGTAFSGVEDGCGAGVAYSGTAVSASVTLPLDAGAGYHWQARTKDAGGQYSSWVSFGGNNESEADFLVTPPGGARSQTAYIFENDDEDEVGGDAFDENTQQAARNTALNEVKSGERVNVRLQMANTSPRATNGVEASLFYDRNDGLWSKVDTSGALRTGAGTCTDTSFDCAAIDSTGDVGHDTSTAVDRSGRIWLTYRDITNLDLKVAIHVGAGGVGCASTAWSCITIDGGASSTDVGEHPSIAFDNNDTPWVAYRVNSTGDLRVAKYVGSGGTGCADTAAWTCTAVDTTNSVGYYTAIVMDSTGKPWVAHRDFTNGDLRVSRFVGSGGTGCNSAEWTCLTVDSTGDVGQYITMEMDLSGKMWVAYQDVTNLDLKVAQYVGSGGSGCNSVEWSCYAVDATGDVGRYAALAFDTEGLAWLAYRDSTGNDLKLARYVGSGGTGCAISTWTCSSIETTGDVGTYVSIGLGPDGRMWVAYRHVTDQDLKLARYVGSGGTGCAIAVWTCGVMDSTALDTGQSASIAFNGEGRAFLAYYDVTNMDLKVASLRRGGELRIGTSLAGNSGDPLNESHADMTSPTDSVNRDDADCAAGGAFNSGRFSESGNSILTLPAGNTTAQCAELGFVIDTSSAVAGQTYRLMLATADSVRLDRNLWRGSGVVTQHPTMTMASVSGVYSKDAWAQFTNCNDPKWGCGAVETTGSMGGNYNRVAFDRDGRPWVAHLDATNLDLRVARYVGSGGTGCATTAWTCTIVEATNNVGNRAAIGFDPLGKAWVAHYDLTNRDLRVAEYVGTGGTGCASTEWSCTTVDATGDVGENVSIAFDLGGNPWLTHWDVTNLDLKAARFVGSGGTGCASTAWSCERIDVTGTVGRYSSLSFTATGVPWVSYYDSTNTSIKVATRVGIGGSGCASPAWSCTTIETTGDVGLYSSLAIGSDETVWVAYQDTTNSDLRIARYVGSGGVGCASAAWSCTLVESANSVGRHLSLALDAQGNPWVNHHDSTNIDLRVSRYVGSGGVGCASTAWTCTAVDVTGSQGTYGTIAFDFSGTPWVAYRDATNNDLKVVKMHAPPTKLAPPTGMSGTSASGSGGRFQLDHGDTTRPFDGSCTAAANRSGYCGVAAEDAADDSITAQANERPSVQFSNNSTDNTSPIVRRWKGRSTVAPSTSAITMEIYRAGSINGWEAVTPSVDTCATAAADTDCTIELSLSTAVDEYYHLRDGIYRTHVRLAQAAGATSRTLSTNLFYPGALPPNTATSLVQRTTGDAVIATGATVSDTSVKYEATVSDANSTDSLSLCVEVDVVGTAFSGVEDVCGSAVSYTGIGLIASVSMTMAVGASYHWQVRVKDASGMYSSWASYGGNAETDTDFSVSTNTAPSSPASLVQTTGADVTIPTGGWHNATTVKFVATASDPDASDTLSLCVEIQPLETAFVNGEQSCGAGVAYSGSPVTATVTQVLSDSTEYHWQVRVRDAAGAYSGWVAYGSNVETARDVGIDTTAPTGGVVYDGTTTGVDASVNDGSLSSLSANWSGFDNNISGLLAYDYAIGTTVGGTETRGWTNVGTAVSVTATGLSLQTGTTYYFTVRANDNAGNQTAVSSNGQKVAEILTFSVSSHTVNLTNAPSAGLQTDMYSVNLLTSTNAAGGYTIRAVASTLPFASGGRKILPFDGGTYASPDSWQAQDTGLGYTSSDVSVQGINKFQSATCPGGSLLIVPGCYAPFSNSGTGDIVADGPGPVENESFDFTYRVTTNGLQAAGRYTANVTFTAVATF